MHALSPEQAYRLAKSQNGFVVDNAQECAVEVLETCFRELHHIPQRSCAGVYLWGPVGRGKTWLMDMFHRGLQQPSRRQHFHHFMQWVHRRLFALSGTADPLSVLAEELARDARVLCFDELFVSDIGDAMLLGRLFQALFDAGVVIIATSNQPPEQLYAEGFNRERFLPAIAALQHHMHVVELDGEQDHRLHAGETHRRYWVCDRHALQQVYTRLSGTLPVAKEALTLGGRQLCVIAYSSAAIWLRFEDLCAKPFAAADFISLCDRFPAILLGYVPNLSARPRPARIARGTEDSVEQVVAGDRELPSLSATDDSARRFITLVDECYDRRVPLYIEAAVPLTSLYSEGHLLFPFRRTLSRLQEMQWQRFSDKVNWP